MGGSNKQEKANKRMNASNAQRQIQIDAQNVENEERFKAYEYQSLMDTRTRKARQDAEAAATAERGDEIRKSSQLLTDFKAQERRRLFHAKTGQGQVTNSDMAITGDMVDNARGLLDRGSIYWGDKRKKAGTNAANNANSLFTQEYGSQQDYVNKG